MPGQAAGLFRDTMRCTQMVWRRLPKQDYQKRFYSVSAVLHSQGKKLFTPGPLGVSMTTKQAMLQDLGSRDVQFIAIVRNIRESLVELAGVSRRDYTCVPMQGSGTFALESVLGTVVPRDGKVLILANGAYGKRQVRICEILGIPFHLEMFPEDQKVAPSRVGDLLSGGDPYSLVAVVHCETSSGVINPVEELGSIVKEKNPESVYFVDAMSSFGAIPVDLKSSNIDYLVSSANKCLEGVPGFSFAIAKVQHLLSCTGNARSHSLDLVDQFDGLERTGQFRFTPPTHAVLALKQALQELGDEGGLLARSKRYQRNNAVLRQGMQKLGFQRFLDDSHSGYIITSYIYPKHPNFHFPEFYQRLGEKGQVIYPGKVLDADCFRIGNIGHLFSEDMEHLVACIESVCKDMGMQLPLSP